MVSLCNHLDRKKIFKKTSKVLCHVAALSFSSFLMYAAGFGVPYSPHPKPTLPLRLCSSTRKSLCRNGPTWRLLS